MPDEMVERLISTRRDERLHLHLGQLCDSFFDLAIHNPSSEEALIALDETKLYLDLNEKFYLRRRPEPSHPHTTFSHLVSGYDAGYYAYICANVFAEELFQTKKYSSRATWDIFRREVLEYGGSRDEWLVLTDFLNHSPTADALFQNLNLPAIEVE